MPVVSIKILEGRTLDQKREMVKKVTEAISVSIEVPKENIWISVEEMPKESFSVGGTLKIDK